jgi:transcriptional regulator with XRE-family HTH domain
MDVTGMIELAKARQNIKSDRELSRKIGLTGPSVHIWRAGKALPSDESLARLAELAGIDPATALLEQRAEISKEPAKSLYRDIARRLAGIAAAIMVMIGVSLPANATGTKHYLNPGNIHYATTVCAAGVGPLPSGKRIIAK